MSPVLKPIPLRAGVNEVPRSSTHFAAQFQLPKEMDVMKQAKGLLRSAWRMRPRGALSGIVSGDAVRGAGVIPLTGRATVKENQKTNASFQKRAGNRGALHFIKLRLHTAMVF